MDRPGSVTAAVVLTWLAAILDLAAGILLVIFAGNDDVARELHASTGEIRLIGFVQIGIGIIIGAVASGLGRGSNGARTVVSVVMIIRIAAAFWAIIWLGSHALTESIWSIAWSVFILALLYNATASAFFAGRRPAVA